MAPAFEIIFCSADDDDLSFNVQHLVPVDLTTLIGYHILTKLKAYFYTYSQVLHFINHVFWMFFFPMRFEYEPMLKNDQFQQSLCIQIQKDSERKILKLNCQAN